MENKTRIRVVLPGLPPHRQSWPHIDYDYDRRKEEVLAALRAALPEVEFSGVVYESREEAEAGYEKEEKGNYDGFLVYISSIWSGIPLFYATKVRPVVISNQLYSGCGDFLKVTEVIDRENLPVPCISSSDFRDTVELVRLLDLKRRLSAARILIFSDAPREAQWGATPEKRKGAETIFGLTVEIAGSRELKAAYAAIDEREAEAFKNRWIAEAEAVIEPDEAEILKSARLYLAVKALVRQHRADAVSIDCLNMFAHGLDAYPCLSFFQLNNEGFTGVCEGDINAAIAQLIFRYLTGKPAYVSDPVIDEAAGQVIYAHCVATRNPENDGVGCPYLIRSHAEDRKGASVQTLLPLGKTVTTIAVSCRDSAMAVYTAMTVANISDEKACRTKLAAATDVAKLARNYHISTFGWHQVTCYGDYRREIKHLAKLLGMKLVEQDRE